MVSLKAENFFKTEKKSKIWWKTQLDLHFSCLESSEWLGIIDSGLINRYYTVVQREGKEFLGEIFLKSENFVRNTENKLNFI